MAKTWIDKDIRTAVTMAKAEWSLEDIGEVVGRSVEGVFARLDKQGYITLAYRKELREYRRKNK